MMAQILYAFLGLVVVGVVLIVLGLRGKKLNDHPVCRGCGFDLEGVFPAVVTCPECGAGLKRAKAVRQGARRKRWVAFSGGTVCVVLPVVTFVLVGGAMLSGADMNKHKPFGLLLLEARHAGPSLAQGAAKEFLSRAQNNTLAPEQVERLTVEALKLQADLGRPWCAEWGDFIEWVHGRGTLPKEDHERYMDQSAVIECKVRPKVGKGEKVPVVVTLKESRAGSASQILVTVVLGEATVGGVAVKRPVQMGGFPGANADDESLKMLGYLMVIGGSFPVMFGGTASANVMLEIDDAVGVGPAEMRLSLQTVAQDMTASRNGFTPGEIRKSGIAHAIHLHTAIVGEDEPTLRVIPESEEITRQLEEVLVPDHVMQHGNGSSGFGQNGGKMISMSFSIRSSRTPFAYEVYALYKDKEVKLGEISSGEEAGDSSDFRSYVTGGSGSQRSIGSNITESLPTQVDLLFKPSERIGKRTIDLKEIYGGQIVVKGVPVQNYPGP